MTPQKNTKQVRVLIGISNYYKDMWSIRSHIIKHLSTLMSSKLKFNLNVVEQKAFGDIKQAVPHYTLLEKQDFNRCFDIYTDAIDYQLVAVIRQESKPIAFYSLKLTVPKT